jgi:seryl-tRNA synthetase
MYQETTKSETIKQQLCLTKLNKLKSELCLFDWKEKTAKYNLTKHQIVDPKEKLNSKQENIIQVPKVIATILAKINAANDSNAEQIMREIRSIANAVSQDAKRNLWKPSEETKKICENIVKIIDLNLPKLDTPIHPTYKK